MKRLFLISLIGLLCINASAQDYKHSIGVNLGGMNGLSYKGLLPKCSKWFVVADLNTTVSVSQGMSWALTFNNSTVQAYLGEGAKSGTSDDQFVYWTFVGHPNFVYQDRLRNFNKSSLNWFVGPGLSFGMMQSAIFGNIRSMADAWQYMSDSRKMHSEAGDNAWNLYNSSNPYAFKIGINACVGMELCLHNSPVNIGFDFRPGWGCYMKPYHLGEIKYDVQGHTLTEENAQAYSSYSFFDWSLGLSIRYRFN